MPSSRASLGGWKRVPLLLSSLLEPVLVTLLYGAITENVYCLHYIKGSGEDKKCNFLKDKKKRSQKIRK